MDFVNSNVISANNISVNNNSNQQPLFNGVSSGSKIIGSNSPRLGGDPASSVPTTLACVGDEMLNQQIHLYNQIEQLRSQLEERDKRLMEMETHMLQDAQKVEQVQQNVNFWEEKYKRLLESHRKLHKVNQTLEDKLLTIVEKYESEKGQMTNKIDDLQRRLEEARILNGEIETENSQYREFVIQRFNSLPSPLQDNVKRYLRRKKFKANPWDEDTHKEEDNIQVKPVRVPLITFPPTAMVYTTTSVADLTIEDEIENGQSSPKITEAIIDLILTGDSVAALNDGISTRHRQYRRQRNNSEVILLDESTQTDQQQQYSSPASPSSSSHCSNCDHHKRNLSCPDFDAISRPQTSASTSSTLTPHYYQGSRSTNGTANSHLIPMANNLYATPPMNRSNRPQSMAAVRLKRDATIIDI